MDKFKQKILFKHDKLRINESRRLNGYTSDFIGRLGNHMFIYAYVRLLAEEENRPFRLKSDLLYRFNVSLESELKATMYERPNGTSCYQEKENLDLLFKYRNILKSWFGLSDIGKKILIDRKFPTVIHVRGTDFIDLNWSLQKDYYYKAIKTIGGNNFLVVTDDIGYARSLFRNEIIKSIYTGEFKYEIIKSDDDLSILYHAERIIMSQSTYCWWGVFLGEHKKVMAPIQYWASCPYMTTTQWGIDNLYWEPIKK